MSQRRPPPAPESPFPSPSSPSLPPYLVHLLPARPTLCLDQAKQRWDGEHGVFYHLQPFAQKVENFRLGTAGAVDHAMDLCPVFIEHLFDDRSVRPRRAEDELAGVQWRPFHRVRQGFAAAVNEGGREEGVEGLRVFFGENFAENVVSGRSEAIRAHATVIGVFVFGLPGGREANYEVSWEGGEQRVKMDGSKNLA